MNKIFSQKKYLMVFLAFAMGISACKKSDDSAESSKTLNKTTLTTKAWYNKGGSIIHDFRANGYYANTGTWKWKNNSDTLEIVTSSGGPKTYWKIFWNTDHEMNCQRSGTPSSEMYKDQLW